jgi:hypothetical protein
MHEHCIASTAAVDEGLILPDDGARKQPKKPPFFHAARADWPALQCSAGPRLTDSLCSLLATVSRCCCGGGRLPRLSSRPLPVCAGCMPPSLRPSRGDCRGSVSAANWRSVVRQDISYYSVRFQVGQRYRRSARRTRAAFYRGTLLQRAVPGAARRVAKRLWFPRDETAAARCGAVSRNEKLKQTPNT